MQPFTIVTGIAAALPRANVDTDQIMPKQFLKGIDRSGLADGFLHDMRFLSPGASRDEFVLNRRPGTARQSSSSARISVAARAASTRCGE